MSDALAKAIVWFQDEIENARILHKDALLDIKALEGELSDSKDALLFEEERRAEAESAGQAIAGLLQRERQDHGDAHSEFTQRINSLKGEIEGKVEDRLNALGKENARLKRQQNSAFCSFCGGHFLKDSDVITQHINECPKHPISALKKEIEELKEKIGKPCECYNEFDGESTIRRYVEAARSVAEALRASKDTVWIYPQVDIAVILDGDKGAA